MTNEVFRRSDGFYCIVDGRTFGPWPNKQYAQAGLQTEERRAAARKKHADQLHEERGRERAKAEGRFYDDE